MNKALITRTNEKIFQENKILLFSEKIVQNEWNDAIRAVTKSIATINECYLILFPRIGGHPTAVAVVAEEEKKPPAVKTTKNENDKNDNNEDEDNEEEEWKDIEWESEEKVPKKSSQVQDVLRGSVPYTLVGSIDL